MSAIYAFNNDTKSNLQLFSFIQWNSFHIKGLDLSTFLISFSVSQYIGLWVEECHFTHDAVFQHHIISLVTFQRYFLDWVTIIHDNNSFSLRINWDIWLTRGNFNKYQLQDRCCKNLINNSLQNSFRHWQISSVVLNVFYSGLLNWSSCFLVNSAIWSGNRFILVFRMTTF